MSKINCLEILENVNNSEQEKNHLFYEIIHFSMQFSAALYMFIVKT